MHRMTFAWLRFRADGLNACEIARRTGIPRATVRGWVAGRTPRRTRGASRGCTACGHAAHDPDALPPEEYAYLLGMYLGDGCISKVQKGVYSYSKAWPCLFPQHGP